MAPIIQTQIREAYAPDGTAQKAGKRPEFLTVKKVISDGFLAPNSAKSVDAIRQALKKLVEEGLLTRESGGALDSETGNRADKYIYAGKWADATNSASAEGPSRR